jgi:hypothetical protein
MENVKRTIPLSFEPLLLIFILVIGVEVRAQQFDFIPQELKPVPVAELKKPTKPLDLVFYEDGRKTTFKEAIGKVESEKAIPFMFADKSGAYKALVISEKIQIDYPGMPEKLRSFGYSFGNKNSNTVVIFSQGGPSTTLSNWKWQKRLIELYKGFGDYFFINSHQAQTLDPGNYDDKELSFEEAKDLATSSTEILGELTSFFKSKGKRVYLYGVSGGAFLVTDLIATKGNIADGYLIMVGRLDMDDEMWRSRVNGERMHFREDGRTLYRTDPPDSVRGKNNDKLKSAYAYKRFTELLKKTDLSNVIYFYGKTDSNVGSLKKHEIEFLRSHGALVIASDGDHSSYQKFIEIGLRLLLLD